MNRDDRTRFGSRLKITGLLYYDELFLFKDVRFVLGINSV